MFYLFIGFINLFKHEGNIRQNDIFEILVLDTKKEVIFGTMRNL